MRTASLAIVVSLFFPVACDKGTSTDGTANPGDQAAASDPVETATRTLLSALGSGDRDGLMTNVAEPLATDLSAEAFSDLSKIVAWLGYVDGMTQRHDMSIEGGSRRTYEVTMEKGTLMTEVTVVNGKLIGFHFSGDDFVKAEHGTIADQFREFKVYDFWFTDEGGARIEGSDVVGGNTVHYHVVVGGIDALGGQHHLSVQKMLLADGGTELFKEPVEYDTSFDENAEGIPRGEVGGHFDVPGPGHYELVLLIRDDIAAIDTEHRVPFKVSK